jgi:hypothetical protein
MKMKRKRQNKKKKRRKLTRGQLMAYANPLK